MKILMVLTSHDNLGETGLKTASGDVFSSAANATRNLRRARASKEQF